MGRRTTATVAALAGVVLLASGCGSETDGKATPSTGVGTSAATAALWDPCTQISDQVLQKVGVVPATKESGISGVQQPGWKVCSWHDRQSGWNYSLGVWSTTNTVDDFQKKSENTNFSDISIAGRSGVTYHRMNDKDGEDCDLLFPAAQGAVLITAFNTAAGAGVAPCDRARAAAETLVPLFPR
ncbi:DUF3558 domain-containing protein [Nocardia sp. NPDC050710]|uniref:DUF3558 domain-containing protein n=1 Tax=Nocardia sp. NPDC050710 TaxID=3157220 RepID=UPI0033DBFF78